jgi:hypothetical protein
MVTVRPLSVKGRWSPSTRLSLQAGRVRDQREKTGYEPLELLPNTPGLVRARPEVCAGPIRVVLRLSVRVEGCRVQGAGCRVQSAGCRVQGAGCRVQGAGCGAQGAGFKVQGFGLGLRV